MKQLFGAGLIALLLISIFPAVVAVTGTEDSQTLSLVSSMEDKTGKEIRLMQLEKAITRNIVAGKVAIEKVKANDIDASELEVILTELEALRLEVKSINPEEEGAVETFVNIKNEAMELSKEFKEIAADLLAQDDITAIENEVNDNPELQEYKLRIKEKIQLKNKESVQKTFDSIGIKNEVLLAKIKNGGVTLAEVKNQIEEKNHRHKAQKGYKSIVFKKTAHSNNNSGAERQCELQIFEGLSKCRN